MTVWLSAIVKCNKCGMKRVIEAQHPSAMGMQYFARHKLKKKGWTYFGAEDYCPLCSKIRDSPDKATKFIKDVIEGREKKTW